MSSPPLKQSQLTPTMNPISPPHFEAIKLKIPPEKTLCLGRFLDQPYLVTTIPLANMMEIRIDSWMEPQLEPPELVVTVMLPNESQRLIRLITQAYMSMLPSLPNSMSNRHPNLAPDLLLISCLVWNVQGAGSREFILALKELIRDNKPNVLALVETHMGGEQAINISKALGYNGHDRVDAVGFSGGIWVFWKPECVSVEPIIKHSQHITMNITRVGAAPWYFSVVYASPDPTKRKEPWDDLRNFAITHNKPWMIAGDFNDTRFPSERSSTCNETIRMYAKLNEWINDL